MAQTRDRRESSGHGCIGHDHSHGNGAASGTTYHASRRRLGLSLAAAATVMLVEAIGGWLSGSLALLSDAGHMLTDVAALSLALLAIMFGARPADSKRTFGYRRLEVLAAQINVGTLFGLAVWIAWEASVRLRSPARAIDLAMMGGVAALGFAANALILFWLHDDHNLTTRAAFLHVIGDTIASVGVLAGAGAMWLWPGIAWVDPVLSIGIALLILWGAVRLTVEISDILMEGVPRHLNVEEIAQTMAASDGAIVAVHDLHVWTISSGMCALSAHLVLRPDAMGRNDEILRCVKLNLFARFGIDHTTLQIESVDYDHVADVHEH